MKSANDNIEWFNEDYVRTFFLSPLNNTLFWTLYFLIDYTSSLLIAPEEVQMLPALYNFVFVIGFFYGTWLLILPESIPFKNGYLLSFKFMIFMLLIIILKWLLSFLILELDSTFSRFLVIELIRCFHFLLLAALVCFILISFKKLQEKYKIQLEASQIELTHYQMIINPHFIANGLNAIHSDIVMGNENTEVNLSEFAEIIAYSYSHDRDIFIEEELTCIHKFLSFQKHRYGQRLIINYKSMVDPILAGRLLIPKMILLTLVENIFKHGDIFSTESPPSISISLLKKEKHTKLQLSIKNKIKPQSIHLKPSNAGHKAVRFILNGYFPKKHSINIHTTENIFNLKLTIIYDQKI